MKHEEAIILENYFNVHQFDNSCPNVDLLNNALTVLLNSKEFTNTGLRMSNGEHQSHLVQLTVDSKNIDGSLVYVSGLYNVTSGISNESRIFNGYIEWTTLGIEEEVKVNLSITRLFSSFEQVISLNETFKMVPFTQCAYRESKYSIDCISEKELVVLNNEDTDEFLEEQVKLVKSI